MTNESLSHSQPTRPNPGSIPCVRNRYGDIQAATRLYSEVVNAVTRGEPSAPLTLRWEKETVAGPASFLSGCFGPSAGGGPFRREEKPVPTFAEASFESPVAAYLPRESKEGKLLFVWRTGDAPPDKIAIHLPVTGDQYYWYRKQIALELLKHDVASVILMFPYYAARKPEGQHAHVLPSVSAFITQVCAGVMESVALASWAAAEYPGSRTVFTGVSMGGSVANVAAILTAAERERKKKKAEEHVREGEGEGGGASANGAPAPEPEGGAGGGGVGVGVGGVGGVGTCPVVSTSSATSFLTGVLHSRIAWDVLEASPAGAADQLNKVIAPAGRPDNRGDGGSGCDDAKIALTACREDGEPLNATEQALADAMECLSLGKLVELMKAARRESGSAMPRLGAAVQVSALDDRFVGRQSDELFALLKGLSEGEGEGERRGGTCERRDIAGGHISTLFKQGEAIVPAIVATFEKLSGSGRGGDAGGDAATRTTAPACLALTRTSLI